MKRFQFSALVISFIILFLSLPGFGQWAAKTGDYYTKSIQKIPGGGYIVASGVRSGLTVKKLDDAGRVIWGNKYYYNTISSYTIVGHTGDFESSPIQLTADGGYIVATPIDRQENGTYGAGRSDIWVLKLNGDGHVEWQKTFGGPEYDYPADLAQTSDGGYVIAGRSSSLGQGGCWVLKLDPIGGIEWEKTYGGYCAGAIEQTPDNGYIVAGITFSEGAGGEDAWVFKLNASGEIETGLQKTFGGNNDDSARVIKQTSDGGYILGGRTHSFNIQPGTSACLWVLKLDASLTIQWQKTYGGTSLLPDADAADQTKAFDIVETSDGHFVVAGTTSHFGHGAAEAWILKLDADNQGSVLWEHTYGATEPLTSPYSRVEYFATVLETSTNDIMTGGMSRMYGGWILSLDASGEIPGCDLMGDSTAIVADSNATVHETHATPEDTAAIIGTPWGVAQPQDAERILFCPDGVDLSVTIDDTPDPVRPDSYYACVLTAANEGSNPATGVTVTADIPAGATFFSATSSQGTSSESGGTVTFDVGDLAGYETATLTIIIRAGASGEYTLNAAIDGNEMAADPDLANNSDTEITRVDSWLTHTVGSNGYCPFGMAVDSGGSVHFAWVYSGKLMYATNASGQWLSWTLADSGQVTSVDVAVDGADNIHIAYGDNYTSLKYMNNTGGTWSDPQTVSDAAGTAWAISMAVGTDNSVHMTFLDCGPACPSALYYATNQDQTPGQWVITTIHPMAYDYAALALDNDNHAHVSFYSMEVIPGDQTTGGIGYLTNAPGGGWQPAEQVDEDWSGCQLEGMVTDIVVDVDNIPHIVYANAYGTGSEDTKYASRETGAWVVEDVDDGGCMSMGKSLAIDENDNVYVSYDYYLYPGPRLMKIADYTGGSWNPITLDNGGTYNALAIDRYNQVHIGYVDDSGDIIYVVNLTTPDTDGDGVADIEEDAAPNSGDGNSDGTSDSTQSRVASLSTSDGQQYVTLVAPADTILTQVRSVVNPSPADAPENTDFLYGFFGFTLLGGEIGQSTAVDLMLPDSLANTYFKYGPTPDQPESHWYSFAHDGQTGAVAAGSTMTLTLLDGQRGDADLAANGIITDPGGPSDGPAGQQHIQVTPASLDFGETDITTSADLSLAIMNTGADNLYVSSISDPDAPFAIVGDLCSGNSLAPGASCETTVRFTPVDLGGSYGEFTVSSDDPAFPVVAVSLSGIAVPAAEPKISVSPMDLDFGDIAVGATADLTVTVTNNGFTTLHLDDVTPPAAPFSIITDTVSGAGLNAGDTAELTVRFAPSVPGGADDSLGIPSDDPDQPLVTVSLTGNGTGDENPVIDVSPDTLDLGAVATSDTFIISNAGTGVVDWTIGPALPDWLAVDPMSGDT
ncbi:MAG: choice-of-anchor D domain-containing protein, partial [Thermodesulfobacteriota bacterium]|nr:choice-of-anchor D domain-containing protein [Thermodesulfobacteriota bacterium]